MFTNPSGDAAGRLIEAAGLKGHRVGGAEVSHLHANFILNRRPSSTRSTPQGGCAGRDPVPGRSPTAGACARDILDLITLVQKTVWADARVWLIPEVQFVGRWQPSELDALYEPPDEAT
jgi:UDP-N-acetylmuramate dehydrogenase